MNLMDLYPLLYVRGIPDSGKGTVSQFRRDNFMLMTREQEAHSFFLPVDKPLEEFDSEEDLLKQVEIGVWIGILASRISERMY